MRDAVVTCKECGKPVGRVEEFVCRFCDGVFHRECSDPLRDRFYLVGPRLVSICRTCGERRAESGQATVG